MIEVMIELLRIKEQICDICHKMWQLGWVAANDGNVTVRMSDGSLLCTPTGISKAYVTPETLIRVDSKGNILDAPEGYRPSSEIKMHLKCYDNRSDVGAVVHAHPPAATAFAVAQKPMDMYNLMECAMTIGSVPIAPYSTPYSDEVATSIEPYLAEHDVILLQNHGALSVGADAMTAFQRMESLELWAKISINAVVLGGSVEISKNNVDKLIGLRPQFKTTGKHPGYKKYSE